MAKTNFQSVDEYLATKPDGLQPILARVRETIRKAVPAAVEGISYQIPAYKLDGTTVLFFAGWQDHYSLYPIGAKVVAAFGAELDAFDANQKGTLRFELSKPVPVRLIARIAKFRAQEVAEHNAQRLLKKAKKTAKASGTKKAAAKATKPKAKAKTPAAKKKKRS